MDFPNRYRLRDREEVHPFGRPFEPTEDDNDIAQVLQAMNARRKSEEGYRLKRKTGAGERREEVGRQEPRAGTSHSEIVAGGLHPHLSSLFSECERQIGVSLNACIVSALGTSQFSSKEEAVMELGRSTLLYITLIHALASENIIITSLLLKVGENLKVFTSRRSSTYLNHLMETEFTFTPDFSRKACTFAKKLAGILEVPQVVIKFLQTHFQDEVAE